MGFGLGMMMGDLSAYANLDLNDKYEGGTATADKAEASWMNVGASYAWKDFTFFADYDKKDNENTTTSIKDTTEQTVLTVGVGHIHEVSSSARINMNASYVMTEAEDKDAATSGLTLKAETTALPIVIGMEADATDWLTLRGSITQNVLIGSRENSGDTTATNNVKGSINGETAVALGATLNYGKLQIDGSLGTSKRNNGTDDDTEEGSLLDFRNVMANASVHYWF